MMRTRRLMIGLLVAILALQIAAFAGGDTFEGEGIKLDLVFGPGHYLINAEDACWVRHGVGLDRFPGLQREVKDDMGINQVMDSTAYYMRLFINGQEVLLEKALVVTPPGHDGEAGTTKQVRLFYVQFSPDYFEAGNTYILTLEIGSKSPNASLNYVYDLPLYLNTALEVGP